MSESSLQMLLHAGEVEYIINTIRAPKLRGSKFVGGCLFGLWRNSLKQPVIQFVTGPGKTFSEHSTVKEMFDNVNDYNQRWIDYMRISHRLLHLGFWFCGTEQDKKEAEKLVHMGEYKYNVLLFINGSYETLTGEYILQTDNVKANSPLYKEDVLPRHSSFRLYEPIKRKIKKDAIELRESTDDSLSKISGLIDNLPSRVQVEEAVTNQEQWYSTDEGMVHLQLISQYLNEAGIFAGMSRDAATHNIQFDLRGGYSLDFPVNFPKRLPLFRSPDGRGSVIPGKPGIEDVCQYVVDVASNHVRNLQEPPGRRGGRGRWSR